MLEEERPRSRLRLILVIETMSKQTYQDRNRYLKEMGYVSYNDYLDSQLWQSIRSKVFKTKGSKCVLCENQATMIHHRGYGRKCLSGVDIGPLAPICTDCHQKVEFKKSGQKRTLEEVQTRFNALVGDFNKRTEAGRKTIRQCTGMRCQNIPKRGENVCGKCKDTKRQIAGIRRWLEKRTKETNRKS